MRHAVPVEVWVLGVRVSGDQRVPRIGEYFSELLVRFIDTDANGCKVEIRTDKALPRFGMNSIVYTIT